MALAVHRHGRTVPFRTRLWTTVAEGSGCPMLGSMRRRALEFDPPPDLVATMDRQRGVFTARQAYAAGYAHDELQRLRDGKVLESVRRGVYTLREPYWSLGDEDRHRVDTTACLLVLKQPTTLSHQTAAVWSRLPLLQPDLTNLHVTRPELKASRREAGIHHHPGALPAAHVHEVNGVRVAVPARIAVDVARTAPFRQGLAVVDSAVRDGTPLDEVRDVLVFCRSWAGARGASRAVAAGDGRAANPGESFSRALLIEAGLAPTDLQVAIYDAEGLVGYADFGWLPLMVLGEFDGRQKYGEGSDSADVLWREKRREDRFRALGFEVVRWTWADLLDPARFIARLRAALARAQARGAVGA